MKAVGIIVEYNPFHNGHLYHAQQAKIASNADLVIAVMSGNFLQRGEPAFIDKWQRAKMALSSSVDIVFELPYAFATATAPKFAEGAIRLLDAALCSSFCFGSEDGDTSAFTNTLRLLEDTKDSYESLIRDATERGLSYPQALNMAYKGSLASTAGSEHFVDLSKPNNILGFHYMEAAASIHSSMDALTIPRVVAQYHDDIVEGNQIASATGIRKSFFETNRLDTVSTFIPPSTESVLSQWNDDQNNFANWNLFYPQLRFIILRDGPVRIREIADITEGIENLLYKAALEHDTFEGFMHKVKSKRYTWTRIQRMLTHIYTGFTYEMREQIPIPSYLRLLGMTKAGKTYLNEHKKRLKLPLVSRAAAFSDHSLQMDIHAANLYALGVGSPNTLVGSDYTHSPIIIN